MMIEGYYVPDGFHDAVQANASRTGNTQFVALCHHHRYTWAVSNLITPHPIFADFRTGKHCSWTYGPNYSELHQLPDLAVILRYRPAKIATSQIDGSPQAEARAMGYGTGRYQGD